MSGLQGVGVGAERALDSVGTVERNGRGQPNRGAAIDQYVRHVALAVERRLIERRQAARIRRVERGSVVDQDRQHRRLFLHDGEVQRRAAKVGAIHRPIDVGGRLLSQPSQIGDRTGRYRREDVVHSAVGEQVIDDFLVGLAEDRRPADDFELVVVARANRIGAVLHKEPDDGERVGLGDKMQREGIVALVADVGVSAALEERRDDTFVLHAEVERCAQSRMPRQHAALVDEIGVSIQDCDECRKIVGIRSLEQGREVRCRRSFCGAPTP